MPAPQPCTSLMIVVQQRTNKEERHCCLNLRFQADTQNNHVWVISQRYNSVLKDLREQTKWLCMFYTKDRDSFENCLRENDVIPRKNDKNKGRTKKKETS